MRLVLAAALLTFPLTASAMETGAPAEPALRDVKVAEAETCDDDLIHQARERTGGGVSRLGELPPADTFLAVHREVDGCLTPLKASEYRAEQARAEERARVVRED